MSETMADSVVNLERAAVYEQNFLKRNKYQKTIAKLKLAGARIAIVVVILALWEFAVSKGAVDGFLMGSPSAIWRVGIAMLSSGQLFRDVSATIYATIVGFLIGSLLGSVCGLLLWYFKGFAKVIDPFAVALNGVPKIALAPMIVIWFGTDIFSKIVLAIIISLPSNSPD